MSPVDQNQDIVPPGIIAIIPARGGSTRLPRKNVRLMGGVPLIAHSIIAARQSRHVAEVIVSTDDPEIAQISRQFGASVSQRPAHLSGAHATSESALLDVLDQRRAAGLADPPLLVFLQCTSPLRPAGAIDRAIEQLIRDKADSLFSATPWAGFLWRRGAEGPEPLHHDPAKRARTQDMSPEYRESGSLYVLKPSLLRATNNRLGGRLSLFEMDLVTAVEVDVAAEWAILEALLPLCPPVPLPRPIRLVVFDFDGVFTDNSVTVTDSGSEAVRCRRDDGLGIAKLRRLGVPMLVISTETNPVVAARCRKLALTCHQGVKDKAILLQSVMRDHGVTPDQVAYLGNDENDLECLRLVGLAVVPADAHPSVLPLAHLILSRPGGQGAVRELCDTISGWVDKAEAEAEGGCNGL